MSDNSLTAGIVGVSPDFLTSGEITAHVTAWHNPNNLAIATTNNTIFDSDWKFHSTRKEPDLSWVYGLEKMTRELELGCGNVKLTVCVFRDNYNQLKWAVTAKSDILFQEFFIPSGIVDTNTTKTNNTISEFSTDAISTLSYKYCCEKERAELLESAQTIINCEMDEKEKALRNIDLIISDFKLIPKDATSGIRLAKIFNTGNGKLGCVIRRNKCTMDLPKGEKIFIDQLNDLYADSPNNHIFKLIVMPSNELEWADDFIFEIVDKEKFSGLCLMLNQ